MLVGYFSYFFLSFQSLCYVNLADNMYESSFGNEAKNHIFYSLNAENVLCVYNYCIYYGKYNE